MESPDLRPTASAAIVRRLCELERPADDFSCACWRQWIRSGASLGDPAADVQNRVIQIALRIRW